MKPYIFAVIYLAIFRTFLSAENTDDTYAGTGELSQLIRSDVFKLTREYEAKLGLNVGVADLNHPRTQSVRYNRFAFDGSKFSEPDQAFPQYRVIFNESSASIDHIAFFDSKVPRISTEIARIKSIAEFRRKFPHAHSMVSEVDEASDPKYERYIWVTADDDGKLRVYWVEAEHMLNSFKLWFWSGSLLQSKKQ